MLAITGGLEMVLAPVAQALGHEYHAGRPPKRTSARQPSKATTVDHSDPQARARAEKRDAAMLMAASKAGIAIEM